MSAHANEAPLLGWDNLPFWQQPMKIIINYGQLLKIK